MIKELYEYATTNLKDEIEDNAFEEKPVRFVVVVNSKGKFVRAIERITQTEDDKKPQVERLRCPKCPVSRTGQVSQKSAAPILACDAIQYLVGPSELWTSEENNENHVIHHNVFKEQIAAFADQLSLLRSLYLFYRNQEEVEKARKQIEEILKEKEKNSNKKSKYNTNEKKKAKYAFVAALALLGENGEIEIAVNNPDVRTAWKTYFDKVKTAENNIIGTCMVTGKVGPIARIHGKIKGLGKQGTGLSLISFNFPSVCSYGWEQNQNCPMSIEVADGYVAALNDLLKPGIHAKGESKGVRTRWDHEDIACLYWMKKQVKELDILEIIKSSAANRSVSASQVFESIYSPSKVDKVLDGFPSNQFFFLIVTPSGTRISVLDWFAEPLEKIVGNVREWFEGLRIADVYKKGEASDYPGLYRLVRCLFRKKIKDKDKALSSVYFQLIKRAVFGHRLGYDILIKALKRTHVEKDKINPARAGLIRLCLNDILTTQGKKGDELMPEKLDESKKSVAYQCGRLFAEYESLQFQAQRKLNASIKERFFASAAATPALIFPTLGNLSVAHLKKLDRNEKHHAKVAIERRICAIFEQINEFPMTLNFFEQGSFQIGYQHQKAENHRRAAENMAKKAAASAAPEIRVEEEVEEEVEGNDDE